MLIHERCERMASQLASAAMFARCLVECRLHLISSLGSKLLRPENVMIGILSSAGSVQQWLVGARHRLVIRRCIFR